MDHVFDFVENKNEKKKEIENVDFVKVTGFYGLVVEYKDIEDREVLRFVLHYYELGNNLVVVTKDDIIFLPIVNIKSYRIYSKESMLEWG